MYICVCMWFYVCMHVCVYTCVFINIYTTCMYVVCICVIFMYYMHTHEQKEPVIDCVHAENMSAS